MKSVKWMGVLAGVGVLAAGAAVLTPSPAPAVASAALADAQTVDGVHSSVVFKIKHMDTANFYGVFKDISGTFNLDSSDASKSSIDVKVKAESIDTRNSGRDAHAKRADFLSVKEFPEITFKSTSVKKTGDKTFDVTGDMTFRGVTKPVTAQVTQTDEAGRGLEAKFSIKRSDFGNNFMVDNKGLSDQMDFIVALEAKK
ncbi:MAG TPA: YceI family protein [Phycisphaerales bacterium]|nr:YceI family protein [Phycisphaerales bacterium]